MDRLWVAVTRLGVRLALLGRRPRAAERWVGAVAGWRPGDVEVRLLLAELALAAGEVGRAIAEAGIAIQLAPDDLRGMSLLLQAEARSLPGGARGVKDDAYADRTADYNLA